MVRDIIETYFMMYHVAKMRLLHVLFFLQPMHFLVLLGCILYLFFQFDGNDYVMIY